MENKDQSSNGNACDEFAVGFADWIKQNFESGKEDRWYPYDKEEYDEGWYLSVELLLPYKKYLTTQNKNDDRTE